MQELPDAVVCSISGQYYILCVTSLNKFRNMESPNHPIILFNIHTYVWSPMDGTLGFGYSNLRVHVCVC